MRLALEGLGVVQPQRTIVDALIDQIQLIEAEDALRDSLEEVDVLLHTYHSLESIHQAIKQCGVTQSIVQLYGENFSSMENDQTDGAEKEVEEKKQGVLGRAWEAIKNLFRKFIDWLGGLFTSVSVIISKLEDAKKKAENCNYPFSVICFGPGTINNAISCLKGLTGGILMGVKKESTDQKFAEIRKAIDSDLSQNNERVCSSAQNAVIGCDNHITLFGLMKELTKGFENILSKVSQHKTLTGMIGTDPGEAMSQYRDCIALCRDIIKANVTSSKNLIAAINKAQK